MAEKKFFIFPTAEEQKNAFVFEVDKWMRAEKQRGFGLNAITEAWSKVYDAKCSLKRMHERSRLLVASTAWKHRSDPRRIAEETPAVRLFQAAKDIDATEWHELYPLFLTAVVYNFPQYLAVEGGVR